MTQTWIINCCPWKQIDPATIVEHGGKVGGFRNSYTFDKFGLLKKSVKVFANGTLQITGKAQDIQTMMPMIHDQLCTMGACSDDTKYTCTSVMKNWCVNINIDKLHKVAEDNHWVYIPASKDQAGIKYRIHIPDRYSQPVTVWTPKGMHEIPFANTKVKKKRSYWTTVTTYGRPDKTVGRMSVSAPNQQCIDTMKNAFGDTFISPSKI